ncbi:hypothetical protein QGN29_08750 [Temperatibacter marinus]|uniref:Uncharacterized protein n=1 Tax=Temperatibacter marinus TaxID=1456591 RepID=A0AA52EFL8_9PROT|nr:hypothetical protein [Temperatibacter marinus]WND01647.1 hypothetical protein QGN29_08750 [Temperatibacter marinus]
MNDLHLIRLIRLYSFLLLYVALSLFAILLVFAAFSFWPYLQTENSIFIILLQSLSGISAAVTGLKFSLMLYRDRKIHKIGLTLDQLIYLPHLIAVSFCLMLSSFLFSRI